MARLIDADKLLTNAIAISNYKGQVAWSAVSTIDILTAPHRGCRGSGAWSVERDALRRRNP